MVTGIEEIPIQDLLCKSGVLGSPFAITLYLYLHTRHKVKKLKEELEGAKLDFGDLNFEWVDISSGTFWMGSNWENDPENHEQGKGRFETEQPVHQVTISKGFQMLKYEVTPAQWEVVMGSNPSYFFDNNSPVECVTWNDCQSFISQLNDLDPDHTYRLPTEAEWEYACRAGTDTSYYYGNDSSQMDNYAWYTNNSNSKTHPVGEKLPNAWGLYDMHGNVWEWCQDDWHDDYSGAPNNGDCWGDGSGSDRVRRGGGWYSDAYCCRSANRGYGDPDGGSNGIGLRLVRNQA